MPSNSTTGESVARALVGAPPTCSKQTTELVGFDALHPRAWSNLVERALEPNAFFQPAWSRAVAAHAQGSSGAQALLAWDGPAHQKLIGFLPVVSAWHALKMPLPVLIAWQAYAPLTVPLLDRDAADESARSLLDAAARAGAQAVLFPSLASESACAQALGRAAAGFGLAPHALNTHTRAMLDATQDAEETLRESLGAKKLKELRRQRNRLSDDGEVTFSVASSAAEIETALDGFLALEAAGWKGKRGTALAANTGDAAFIRRAMLELAPSGHAQVATLARGGTPIAAGLLVRHNRRAYFFKIAYDETFAKTSPGVQLCMDITRHLCADPEIDSVDSIAVADHPMINHLWRGRLQIADVLVPTKPGALPFRLCAGIVSARHAARQAARQAFHTARQWRNR